MKDSNYQYLVLGLNFDSSGTVFSDSRMHTVSSAGTVLISTNQYKFGNSSAWFDGSSGFLTVQPAEEFTFRQSPFTIEFWIYPTSLSHQLDIIEGRPLNTNGIYPFLCLATNGLFYFYINSNNYIWTTSPVNINTWTHVALSKSSNLLYLAVNGIIEASATDTFNYQKNNDFGFRIGFNSYNVTSEFYQGYIDDLKVYKGIGKYTSNFSLPTSPFDYAAMGHSANGLILPRQNPDINGLGILSGTTKVQNSSGIISLTPNRLVRLFDQRSGKLVDQTRSNINGVWSFPNLSRSRNFFVADYDDSHTYNAVIADNLYPG